MDIREKLETSKEIAANQAKEYFDFHIVGFRRIETGFQLNLIVSDTELKKVSYFVSNEDIENYRRKNENNNDLFR